MVLELEVGENVLLLEDNHITISKPRDRDSRLFTALVNTMRDAIDESVPASALADKPEIFT